MQKPLSENVASLLSALSRLIVEQKDRELKRELREVHRRLSTDFAEMRRAESAENFDSMAAETMDAVDQASQYVEMSQTDPAQVKSSLTVLHEAARSIEHMIERAC